MTEPQVDPPPHPPPQVPPRSQALGKKQHRSEKHSIYFLHKLYEEERKSLFLGVKLGE